MQSEWLLSVHYEQSEAQGEWLVIVGYEQSEAWCELVVQVYVRCWSSALSRQNDQVVYLTLPSVVMSLGSYFYIILYCNMVW